MNDTELDDMLNQWEAPEVPARLRKSIKLPPPERKWKFSWPSWHLSKGLLAGAAIGAVLCLFGVAAAFPQAIGPTPRFFLMSELINHNDDGSTTIDEYRRSTAQDGREIIIDRRAPNSWFMTIHMNFFDTVHRLIGLEHSAPAGMGSDCSVHGLSVVRDETILGYQTVMQRAFYKDGTRYTEWRAPALDCIVMKTTWEEPKNGELKLTEERIPMTVVNRAQ